MPSSTSPGRPDVSVASWPTVTARHAAGSSSRWRDTGSRHGILDVRQPEVLQELDAFLPDDRNLHARNLGFAHLARKIRS